MAAATANRADKRQDGELLAHPVAAVTLHKGTLACHNATGYLAPGADTANFKFAGVTYEKGDNSAGAAGGKECRVRKYGEYEFVYNGDASQALAGAEVYIVDDQTVDEGRGGHHQRHQVRCDHADRECEQGPGADR